MRNRIPTITTAALTVASLVYAQQGSRPTLEQLDRETRSLYAEIQGSVVQVQLPPPMWVNNLVVKDNPLEKWGDQLDPEMRKKLEEHVDRAKQGEYRPVNAEVKPSATQPTTNESQPTTTEARATVPGQVAHPVAPAAGGSVTLLAPVRTNAGVQWQPVTLTFSNHIGVVVDDQGDILVPLYVEKEIVGNRTLTVTLADGQTVGAQFVGSDRMMNLTVLKMNKPLGKAARVAEAKPAEGSLVMLVSPNSPGARMVVWTGGHQDMGLVAGMDGRFWGFARFGHFLELDDCAPVVDQLIKTGVVRRAQLGVIVQEVRGAQPALKIIDVLPNSAAARAGLKPEDLILTLSDKPVGDVTSFAVAISQSDGPTTLKVIHEGQPSTITVDLKPQ